MIYSHYEIIQILYTCKTVSASVKPNIVIKRPCQSWYWFVKQLCWMGRQHTRS